VGVSQRSAVTACVWRFIVWLPTLKCVAVAAANRVVLQVPDGAAHLTAPAARTSDGSHCHVATACLSFIPSDLNSP
jgi:hypothetical protein